MQVILYIVLISVFLMILSASGIVLLGLERFWRVSLEEMLYKYMCNKNCNYCSLYNSQRRDVFIVL